VANLSKTLHANFYQNRSTFAEVMHKSILVFFMPHSVYLLSFTIVHCRGLSLTIAAQRSAAKRSAAQRSAAQRSAAVVEMPFKAFLIHGAAQRASLHTHSG